MPVMEKAVARMLLGSQDRALEVAYHTLQAAPTGSRHTVGKGSVTGPSSPSNGICGELSRDVSRLSRGSCMHRCSCRLPARW